MSETVERVIFHAECLCGERAFSPDGEDVESWLACSGECPGGPVVVTRVTFTARRPERQGPDPTIGEAEEVTRA